MILTLRVCHQPNHQKALPLPSTAWLAEGLVVIDDIQLCDPSAIPPDYCPTPHGADLATIDQIDGKDYLWQSHWLSPQAAGGLVTPMTAREMEWVVKEPFFIGGVFFVIHLDGFQEEVILVPFVRGNVNLMRSYIPASFWAVDVWGESHVPFICYLVVVVDWLLSDVVPISDGRMLGALANEWP